MRSRSVYRVARDRFLDFILTAAISARERCCAAPRETKSALSVSVRSLLPSWYSPRGPSANPNKQREEVCKSYPKRRHQNRTASDRSRLRARRALAVSFIALSARSRSSSLDAKLTLKYRSAIFSASNRVSRTSKMGFATKCVPNHLTVPMNAGTTSELISIRAPKRSVQPRDHRDVDGIGLRDLRQGLARGAALDRLLALEV